MAAQLEPIMVAQTTRVALIVVFAPFLVISLAGRRTRIRCSPLPIAPWLPVLALLVVSAVRRRAAVAHALAERLADAAAVHRTLRSGLGWIEGRMPDLLLIAAQIVIGSSLGAQFRPEFLTRLFGLLWASCAVRAVRRRLDGAVRRGHCVAHRLFGADHDPGDGARRPRRDGAHRQAARSRRHLITGFQLMRIIVVLIWCRTALILFKRLADWTFGKAPKQ